jgi:hypothetical protein
MSSGTNHIKTNLSAGTSSLRRTLYLELSNFDPLKQTNLVACAWTYQLCRHPRESRQIPSFARRSRRK